MSLLIKQDKKFVPFKPAERLSKEDTIKHHRNEIKRMLKDFSSEEWQYNEWIKNREKTVVFPTEIFCMWLDDYFPEKYIDGFVEDRVLTQDEANELKIFSKILQEFSKLYHDKRIDTKGRPSIMEYEPWKAVRAKAKETLEKLGWGKEEIKEVSQTT